MKKIKEIDLKILKKKPDIKGSVQDMYKLDLDGKPHLLIRTSDSGSIFDVGTIFSVPRSDVLRTSVRHLIYTALGDPKTWQEMKDDDFGLCLSLEKRKEFMKGPLLDEFRKKGVRTHHLGMVDMKTGQVVTKGLTDPLSNLVLIRKFPVIHPVRFSLWGKHGWDYHEYLNAKTKVVALENIFRLGNPGGSSLQQRYVEAIEEGGQEAARAFLKSVGLDEDLKRWGMFSNMIYDCTTKYEPSDRHLSWQETIQLSGVPGPTYERFIRTLACCTAYVSKFFRELGFQLWDLKWEGAVDKDQVYVVDTIDPDSIRVTGSVDYQGRRCFVHFNKQAVRDYYKLIHAEWYAAINDAKKAAKSDPAGREFMEIYRAGVKKGKYPEIPPYDERFSRIQSRKYAMMVEPFTKPGRQDEIRKETEELMKEEIDLFKSAGKLDQLLKMNSV